MDQILKDIPFARLYLYNIMLFSNSIEEHLSHLCSSFKAIGKEDIKLKFKKCAFSESSVNHLGHLVGKDEVHVCKEKIMV